MIDDDDKTPRIIAKPVVRMQGLAPHVSARTQVLILGSFPGVASLKAQQYYGHPRNHFWPLVGEVFDLPLLESDYPMRLALLMEHHVGLWDVITETARQGSLDSNIRDPLASDLRTLLGQLPALRTIAFNGGTAYKMGLRQLGEAASRYRILALPSSSPAYTLAYAKKLKAWRQISLPE
jgi:hypoxanthine-DNA glycosylase